MFVGRMSELARLQTFFEAAVAGQAQVCFVAGEAGAGKTALVGEFVRRAQEQDERVLAAVGQCNAQTGAGDAYLPFRELLTALTGVADERAASSADETNTRRLKDLLVRSTHVLVEFGPDLIGTLVPGTLLIAKFGRAVAQKAGLLDELERLVKRKEVVGGSGALEQSRIFEQYANVLMALAKEQPLLLILDDLQWADSASLGLLFHLSRNLTDSRVLIVGTYRPDDVALGREGQRHPLEPVLNEIKRYRGDVVIDLGAAQAAERHTFVDALVDAESNGLGETFRQDLFTRTDGHPLFTVELLHNLQERGDLLKDADGRWVTGPSLDWDALPARVEGVIAERITRLSDDLHETLGVASVVGTDFAAQVVARVRQASERDLVRQLSRELDRRHHLVHEQGEVKIGRQFLSLYRFSHGLFQQYLYDELSAGERRVLHGDVAAALEALYVEHTDEVAVQLARHYQEAGDDEHALIFLIRAGDAAYNAYAYTEAAAHYTRALTLGAQSQSLSAEQLQHLYMRRGRACELDHQFEQALRNYDEMLSVARQRGNQQMELTGQLAAATLHSVISGVPDAAKGEDLSSAALKLARELGDRAGEAKALWNLMLLHIYLKRDLPQAIAYGMQSLAIARELDLREQVAYATTDLGAAYLYNGQLDEAERSFDTGGRLWHALGNLPMLAYNLNQYMVPLLMRGKYEKMTQVREESYRTNQASKSQWAEGPSNIFLAYVGMERGEFDQALKLLEEGIRLCLEEKRTMFPDLGRASLFWCYEALGALEKGARLYRALRRPEEEVLGFSVYETWTRVVYALFEIASGQLQAAETTLRHCKPAPALPETTWVQLAQSRLVFAQGDYLQAVALADAAADRMRQIGMHQFLPDVLFAKGQAHAKLGEWDAAKAAFAQARAEAEAFGCRRMLWQILLALAALEDAPANASMLRTQAWDVIDFIVAHTPPDLRADFLKLTEVDGGVPGQSSAS